MKDDNLKQNHNQHQNLRLQKDLVPTYYDNKLCIFCQSVKKVSSKDGPAEPESLYNVASMDFGTKHRDMAAEIDDPILVLRMDRGDLIADEGKYH